MASASRIAWTAVPSKFGAGTQRIQLWIAAAVCGGRADLGEPQVMAAAGRVLFEENMADAVVRDLSGA